MLDQTTLFDTDAERKFVEFNKKNPQIYDELVDLTRDAHSRGRRLIGIKMLIEVVRWNRFIQTSDLDYKINNNYAPRYARKIMDEHPEFGEIFNLRELRK